MKTMIAVVASALAGALVGGLVSQAGSPAASHQQALLAGRSVLAGTTVRAGSPPSGSFLTADNRAVATAGVTATSTSSHSPT